MKTIELVTGCYAVDRPWYAALLCYQLSSLVMHPPKNCKVCITVFRCWEDSIVHKILRYFTAFDVLDCVDVPLPLPLLGRRAYWRNICARETVADIVWFVDPDYLFREGALDVLAAIGWPKDANLVFPISLGEQQADAVNMKKLKSIIDTPRAIDLTEDEIEKDFFKKKFFRAIGSIQIVQGDFARKHGYCPNHEEHQTPVTDGFNNYNSKCDLAYRLFCKRVSGNPNFQQAIHLPNVYRMSHPHRKQPPGKIMAECGWNDA